MLFFSLSIQQGVYDMTINLDMSQIFSYASDIINSLLPVIYVAAGIGLGFVVVNKIISAFR